MVVCLTGQAQFLNGWRHTASIPPSYDADAQTYFDAVTTASGSLTTTEKGAVNDFVVSCKADGTWTQIKGAYPFMGGNATAVGINLKSPGTYNMTFASGVSYGSYGIALSTSQNGDVGATSSAILTGFSTGSSKQGHLSFMVTNDATNTGGSWGSYGSTTSGWRLQLARSGHFFSDVYGENATGARLIDFSHTTDVGFFLGNRLNATSHRLIVNGTVIQSSTADISSAGASPSSVNLYLNSRNSNSEYQSGQYIIATMGLGLTTTQESTLYAAESAFKTALGR